MLSPDLQRIVDKDHEALDAFVQGDAEPKKRLYSRADDATLANPFGPPARGWEQVSDALQRAASLFSDGEPMRFERISEYETPELAYTMDIEHARLKIAGSPDKEDVELRVTTIWRKEHGEWRTVHRHADPITEAQSPQSIAKARRQTAYA